MAHLITADASKWHGVTHPIETVVVDRMVFWTCGLEGVPNEVTFPINPTERLQWRTSWLPGWHVEKGIGRLVPCHHGAGIAMEPAVTVSGMEFL